MLNGDHLWLYSGLDEKILHQCVLFLDSALDTLPGAHALETFYSESGGMSF